MNPATIIFIPRPGTAIETPLIVGSGTGAAGSESLDSRSGQEIGPL